MKNNYQINANPKTNEKCCFYFNEWRLSVLKTGIIRLEKSNVGFNDVATQIVINRYFEKPKFVVKRSTESLKIIFDYYTFVFNGEIESSYIIYKNKKLSLNNDYNLGGTYSTVDGMDGENFIYEGGKGSIREIGLGVCSRNGVAIIDDSNSYCFDGEWKFSFLNKNEIDVYVFFYPNDYKNAVRDYFEISGYPPKLPRYIFGNWWSRYYAYSDKSYLHLMDEFIDENIPFTVATIDMDWHYSSSNGRNIFKDLEMNKNEFIHDNKYICNGWDDSNPMSLGWTGFIWNKKLFPDYKNFLNELKKRNLNITLNIHPNDGIAFYEKEFYDVFTNELNINNKKNIPFDFTDDKNRDLYFRKIFNKYEDEGVDFWWIDWQQGEKSKIKGLKPIWLCNHYFYLDNMRKNSRPLILSRYCGIGGQRYPLGFSGDSIQSYNSLKYLVKTTSMASNIGFTYWSHDVGGHMMGYKDGEQFLKFVQFATFSPILRLHCSCEEVYDKNPSLYLSGYGELIKKYLRLRHQLIPFIYSHMITASKYGKALLEPLYYLHSEDEKAYEFASEEYYFASNLLVAPYVKEKDSDGYSKKDVYFPNGVFYDYKYGYKYKGNNSLKIYREVDDIPVFIKEGQFLILDHNKIGNDISNPKVIDVITTYGEGEYCFYEDDNSLRELETRFFNKLGQIRIKINGTKELYQKERVYKFKVLNVFKIKSINVENASLNNVYIGKCLEFDLSDVSFEKEVIINYEVEEESDLSLAIKQSLSRLSYLDDDNLIRNDVYLKITKAKNIYQLVNIINDSSLTNINKECLLEVLNFAR